MGETWDEPTNIDDEAFDQFMAEHFGVGCCSEPECRRKKPFRIRRGGLSGRVYLITDFTVDPRSDGQRMVMKSRHDITEEIERFMRSEGWTP